MVFEVLRVFIFRLRGRQAHTGAGDVPWHAEKINSIHCRNANGNDDSEAWAKAKQDLCRRSTKELAGSMKSAGRWVGSLIVFEYADQQTY